MKTFKIRFIAILLSTMGLLSGAYGQLTPSQDSYTSTGSPTINYGAKPVLNVQGATLTTFIQFDLSAIPDGYTGSNITKASLKLYVSAATTAGSVNVDYVNGAWSEGSITGSDAPALGSTIVASAPLTAADKNQYIVIDITSAVQAWLNGTPNDGIALVGNGTVNVSFDSKENTTTSHPPELDIVFAGGSGSGISGITTANGSGLAGGGTSGNLNLSLINSCNIGQVLAWNGAGGGWVCSTVSGGGGGISGSGTVNSLPLFNGVTSIGSSNVFQSATNTNIGIGTTTPQATLDVEGPGGVAPTVNFFGTSSLPGTFAVNGNTTLKGNLTVTNGAIVAPSFAGSGASLTNVNAATFNELPPSSFAIVFEGNNFNGNQSITGTLNVSGAITAPSFSGSGASLANVNAAQFGGLPPSAYPTLAGNNNFAGGQSIMGTLNANGGIAVNGGVSATGTIAATSFTGNGSLLTSVNALTLGGFSPGTFATLGGNTFTGDQSITGQIIVSGGVLAGGGAVFPSTGNSPTSGSPSSPLDLTASASNGTTASYQTFRWQAANVDGGTPSANLNLLFGAAGATPAPTGLSIAPNGIISFAANQTFPGGGGGGITSVTGTNGVNASTSGGSVTLSANQGVVAFQTDLTAGIKTAENYASANFLPLTAASTFATLGANTFTGNQTITGSLSTSGNVGIGTTTPQATLDVNGNVNALTGFNVKGNLFAFGSYGSGNAFLGFAGTSNDTNTGNYNAAVGAGAFLGNTTGSRNTAVGFEALYGNTTGSDNIAIGDQALSTNTSGSGNTVVGGFAWQSQSTIGNNNSALGIGAGVDPYVVAPAINYSTAIGAFADVTQSNSLVLGAIANTGNCAPANGCTTGTNVGIGTTAPQSTLDVHGNTSITGNLNVTGTVTCGSGCSGGGGGGGITNIVAGTGLSGGGSTPTVTLNNTGVLTVTPGTGIATGGTAQNPVININTNIVPVLNGANSFSGNQNVNGNISASGEISTSGLIFAGSMSTFGTMNAGSYALGGTSVLAHAPSTGGSLLLGENTGNSTLLSSLDISSTTAIGDNTLRFYTGGNYNTALGNSALYEATSGANNTGAGYEALFHNTSGSNNTAMGYNAGNPTGFQNTTGSNNTFLGANSSVGNQLALNYAAAIGSGAVVGQNNAMVLGGPAGSAAAVNVGIGTSTPGATLDVEGFAATPPTVNFGSVSVPATLTVNGSLNVTGAVTCGSGCSGGGGGGGITQITAGTGITGGGTGPNVPIALNTTFTDARYSQLGATNTFVGTQTISSSAGNGISATSTIGTGVYGTGAGTGVTGSSTSSTGTGVYGTASGTGVGVTGSSPVQGVFGVALATSGTASGVLGQSNSSSGTGVTGLGYTGVNGMGAGSGVTGTSTSATGSGVVGIENSGGGYAGYFQGNVAVTGNLSIGGDTPISHSPRMTFSGTVANFTTSQFQPAGYLVLDEPIVITRFTTATGNQDNISQCGPYSQMGFIVSVPSFYTYLITTGNVSYADSGPLNVLVPAGANIQIVGLEANGSGGAFCQSGGNMTATIQYAMQ